MTKQQVVVDCFPEAAQKYAADVAVVVIDVIRATTTATTSVELGRRCYPVPSIEAALPIAAKLDQPLLVGELGGNMPYGFDVTNSPAEIASRRDVWRPMILLSSSGTQLLHHASTTRRHTYVACLRNVSATIEHLAGRHDKIAVIGAGTRGEFREEDQFCCARIAAGLAQRGYDLGNLAARDAVARWRGAADDAWVGGNSVEYLRRTGQLRDLDFILAHIDDLDTVSVMANGEVVAQLAAAAPAPRAYTAEESAIVA
jgi:2-phosphosulfolactate phosphatase